MSVDTNAQARMTRRGIQLFQLALRMEVGPEVQGEGGAEALFYLADAIARVAAVSKEPRFALKTVKGLFDKIDDAWFEKNHDGTFVGVDQLLADVGCELSLGQDDGPAAEMGPVLAKTLAWLTDAIVRVAALNSQPRVIIEHVVQRLDASPVEGIRKEHLKL